MGGPEGVWVLTEGGCVQLLLPHTRHHSSVRLFYLPLAPPNPCNPSQDKAPLYPALSSIQTQGLGSGEGGGETVAALFPRERRSFYMCLTFTEDKWMTSEEL